MKKVQTINIEVSEEEFFAFQLFKKSVERAAVVYKYRCGYDDNEYISILDNEQAHEKIKKVMDEMEDRNKKEVYRLLIEMNKKDAEIKQLKHQFELIKWQQSKEQSTMQNKKPWFQFTIGR